MNHEHDHEVAVGARLRSGLPGLAVGIGGDADAFARIEHGIARHGRRRRRARGVLGACGVVAALGGAAVVAARPGDDGRGLAVGTPGSNGTVGTSPASPASVPSDGELSAPAGTVASWPVPGPGGTLPEGLSGDEVFPLIDVPEGWEIEAVEVSPANATMVIALTNPPVDATNFAPPGASLGKDNPVIVLRHPASGARAIVTLANPWDGGAEIPPTNLEVGPPATGSSLPPADVTQPCVWHLVTAQAGPWAAGVATVEIIRVVVGANTPDASDAVVVPPLRDDLLGHVTLTDRAGWDAFLSEARAEGATVDEHGDGLIVLQSDGPSCFG